jgi:equilibrative nucleoside transporter 1/2/3
MAAITERLRALLEGKPRDENDQEYEQLVHSNGRELEDDTTLTEGRDPDAAVEEVPFHWLEYAVFMLLGVAMLWAW